MVGIVVPDASRRAWLASLCKVSHCLEVVLDKSAGFENPGWVVSAGSFSAVTSAASPSAARLVLCPADSVDFAQVVMASLMVGAVEEACWAARFAVNVGWDLGRSEQSVLDASDP